MATSKFQLQDLIPLLATGIGAWSVFPKPPEEFSNLLDPAKNTYALPFRWALVFVLIWQGQGGRDVGQSLIGTLVMFLIAQAFNMATERKVKRAKASIAEQLSRYA